MTDSNRNAQTFLTNLRQKYPQYNSYDDITLMSQIKKKYPEYSDISQTDIPKSENVLQNAIKNAGINFAVAGLPSAVNPSSRPEDALPPIAQFGTDSALKSTPEGRIASMIPGVKFAATIGATTGAEGVRQGTKYLRGEGFNPSEIAKTAGTTALTEGAGRLGEKALFGTEIGKDVVAGAKKNLGEALGKLFEVAKTNPSIQIAKADLLGFLEHAYDKVPFKIGPQANGLGKVIKTISEKFPDMIGPKEISDTENMLGDIANFNAEAGGALKNKAANLATKEARRDVSTTLEHMANQAGVPEVSTASKEAHLAQKFNSPGKPGLAQNIGSKVGMPAAIGALAGGLTHSPAIGGAAALGDILMQHEPIKNFLYNLIIKSGASRAGRVGVNQVIRNNS